MQPVTHRLNHSNLLGLLRGTISRKTLQLYHIRRGTTTHGDPFDSCWSVVRLYVHFTTWCEWRRDTISPASASSRRLPSLSCPYPLAATSIPCPGIAMEESSLYPTILEQPVVWEFGVVRVHLDRKCTDIFYLQMQSLNLLLRERVTALFRVDSSVVQNFVWNVVK